MIDSNKQWHMALTVRQGENREKFGWVLTQIGYRGTTHYMTKEEAETTANEVFDKAVKADPSLPWFAIWFKPWTECNRNENESGLCYSRSHNK